MTLTVASNSGLGFEVPEALQDGDRSVLWTNWTKKDHCVDLNCTVIIIIVTGNLQSAFGISKLFAT